MVPPRAPLQGVHARTYPGLPAGEAGLRPQRCVLGSTGRASESMSRVLVTGGAGFIPSNLIRHLLEHTDHEVISLDALTYAGNLENLADVMSHPRLEFVHGDIRDAGLVR